MWTIETFLAPFIVAVLAGITVTYLFTTKKNKTNFTHKLENEMPSYSETDIYFTKSTKSLIKTLTYTAKNGSSRDRLKAIEDLVRFYPNEECTRKILEYTAKNGSSRLRSRSIDLLKRLYL